MEDQTVLSLLMGVCNCVACRADAPCKYVLTALDAIEVHYAAQLQLERTAGINSQKVVDTYGCECGTCHAVRKIRGGSTS